MTTCPRCGGPLHQFCKQNRCSPKKESNMTEQEIEEQMEVVRGSISKDAWVKRRAETIEHVISSLNEVGTDASNDAAFMVNDLMTDYRSLVTRISELETELAHWSSGRYRRVEGETESSNDRLLEAEQLKADIEGEVQND